jgi:predicted secreted protein
MSVIGWVGRTLRIGIDGQILAAVRAKSVAYVNTPIDLSDGERNGFRRLAEQGDVRSIDVSVDGVATVENWPVLRDAWEGEEFVSLTIEQPDGSTFTADAVLAALSRTGEHSGAVGFSASFQLSGVLDDGDYLTSEIYPTPTGPDPGSGPGIDAGAIVIANDEDEETFSIGYAATGYIAEGAFGSIDPEVFHFGNDGEYELQAVADIFDTDIFTGITEYDLFVVAATEPLESDPPPKDCFASMLINGKVYNTEDCTDLGSFESEFPTYTATAASCTIGGKRFWWWPELAGFVELEHYPFQ